MWLTVVTALPICMSEFFYDEARTDNQRKRQCLADRGDDLVREARELREKLEPLGLEALDKRRVLVAAASRLVQPPRLQQIRVRGIDPGHDARDQVPEVRVLLP